MNTPFPSTETIRLFLASTSPYRRSLLARLQQPFATISPDVDESPQPGETAEDLAKRLAIAKSQVKLPNSEAPYWVIGSDQVLAHGSGCLGKPGHHRAAVQQLLTLSGETVCFYTGVAVTAYPESTTNCAVVTTTVQFRELSLAMIETYLAREPAYDCAGAAKCEGLGIRLMRSIQCDDPTALIGLPLIALTDLLDSSGYAWQ